MLRSHASTYPHFSHLFGIRCGVLLLVVLLVTVSWQNPSTAQKARDANPATRPGGAASAEKLLTNFRTTSKLAPGDLYVATDDLKRLSQGPRLAGASPTTLKNSVSYAALHIEFDTAEHCQEFGIPEAPVISRLDRFANVFVRMDETAKKDWEKIASLPGVVEVQLSGVYAIPNSAQPSGAPAYSQQDDDDPPLVDETVHGGVGELKGKGVIIAIIDSGIDFRNPDFVTYDANGKPTSRLLYYWDTTDKNTASVRLDSKPPLSYPNGAPVGTLYTQKQLTEELRSDWPHLPSGDLLGHGTACAGIAAGNGNNDPAHRQITLGVAPEADLIAVRIGGTKQLDGSLSYEVRNGYLLDAICDWLDSIALRQPLVISCSWGSQAGGMGTSRIIERQLNARFAGNTRGRAIVLSAGNAAEAPWHAALDVVDKKMSEPVRWQTDEGRNAYLEIDFDSDNVEGVTVTPADGTTFQDMALRTNPFTKRAVAYISVSAGAGGIYLKRASGTAIHADLYLNYGHFVGQYSRADGIVGSPAAAANAFAVGSYAFNGRFNDKPVEPCAKAPFRVGGLSCYSSGGIVTANYVKPDLVAPGEVFYASYAKQLYGRGSQKQYGEGVPEEPNRIDKTRNYRRFDGTSASAPYVAGVIALVMQKDMLSKNASAGELMRLKDLKRLFQQHATKDQFTATVPNPMWGYGKLDLPAVKKILNSVGARP